MDSNDILTLITAAYKDKVERDLFENLRAGMNELFAAEADSRREKVAADIMQRNKLQIALRKFEMTYSMINDEVGTVDAIDDYIADIQMQIRAISYKKNHLKK